MLYGAMVYRFKTVALEALKKLINYDREVAKKPTPCFVNCMPKLVTVLQQLVIFVWLEFNHSSLKFSNFSVKSLFFVLNFLRIIGDFLLVVIFRRDF